MVVVNKLVFSYIDIIKIQKHTAKDKIMKLSKLAGFLIHVISSTFAHKVCPITFNKTALSILLNSSSVFLFIIVPSTLRQHCWPVSGILKHHILITKNNHFFL